MATCYVCQKPKATLVCGSCKEDICKNCTQFLEEDYFSFMTVVPSDLAHSSFCNPCYDFKIVPQIEEYDAMKEQAKNISVFIKDQGKETRNFKRTEPPVSVANCPDREETLLRLAFMAVEKKFNGLIDVDIVSEKVRIGAYQTQKFSGTAIPVTITASTKRWT